jgi:hypothetical protein
MLPWFVNRNDHDFAMTHCHADRQKRYSDMHDAFAINTQSPADGQRYNRGRGRDSRTAA